MTCLPNGSPRTGGITFSSPPRKRAQCGQALGGTEIWLRILCPKARRLEIVIEDHGVGFDPSAASTGGNGLDNMCKRMTDIGGKCEIEARAGRARLSGCASIFRPQRIPEHAEAKATCR